MYSNKKLLEQQLLECWIRGDGTPHTHMCKCRAASFLPRVTIHYIIKYSSLSLWADFLLSFVIKKNQGIFIVISDVKIKYFLHFLLKNGASSKTVHK